MEKACGTCLYWVNPEGKTHGECHRNPPIIGEQRWPVAVAHEWCGEWKMHPQHNKATTQTQTAGYKRA